MERQLLNFKFFLIVCLMMLLGSVNVNAGGYEIVFLTNTSDKSSIISNNTNVADVVGDGATYVSGFTSSCSRAYFECISGVKLGSSSGKGVLEFNIAEAYQKGITGITVKSVKYKSDTGTLTLYNGTTELKSGITPGDNFTYKFSEATTVSSIKLETSANRAYISEIILLTDPVKQYDVAWSVNGKAYTEGNPTIKVTEDGKVTTLPTAPSDINGKVFVGWTDTPIAEPQEAKPINLFTEPDNAPSVNAATTYYAVFANRMWSETTYAKLASNDFKTDATYVIGAEGNNNNIDYFYSYSSVDDNCSWGKMTSDTSVDSPIKFTLSGSASSLLAKDEKGNYLTCVGKNFKMSSTTSNPCYLKLENGVIKGTSSGDTYTLRYNNSPSYGLRWYTSTTGNEAYFYEVIGGYTYSGYCTTVADPTYTQGKLNFVAKDGTTYYATFSSDKVTFIPTYVIIPTTVTVGNDGKIELNYEAFETSKVAIDNAEVEGYWIPANTGVLLMSDNAQTTYYTVDNKTLSALAADKNMLEASVNAGAITADDSKLYYKLAYDNYTTKTGLGFYWGADNGGAFYVKAGTAYLAVPTTLAAGAKGFTLSDEATGINGVSTKVADSKNVYNLNGQRIASMAKPGLYIVNGKKVVVRK